MCASTFMIMFIFSPVPCLLVYASDWPTRGLARDVKHIPLTLFYDCVCGCAVRYVCMRYSLNAYSTMLAACNFKENVVFVESVLGKPRQ